MFVPKIKYYTFVTVKILRKIAIVLVPVYWVITWLYHKLYDFQIFKLKAYQYPVICVGNLVVGGTGKTPMIEYLIEQLQPNYRIATLSRGYKRASSGFVLANAHATAESIGDEPFQFFSKYQNLIVAVDENRNRGIEQLLNLEQKPQVILLDDAFQHRKVKVGCNILLTAFNDLYCDDLLLPTGNLREPIAGAKRAQIVVVTKCPMQIDAHQQMHISKKLKIKPHQSLFFSSINYSDVLKNGSSTLALSSLRHKPFTLITGIANPKPLLDFLNENEFDYEHLCYGDHHVFLDEEIQLFQTKQLIIITEKDFTRLKPKMPNTQALYYLPITTVMHNASEFNKLITAYVAHY